jgi:hypothetical protein
LIELPEEAEERKEEELAGKLKGLAEIRMSQESKENPYFEGYIDKNSSAAKIESAFGKVSSAIAEERGLNPNNVQKKIIAIFPNDPDNLQVDIELANELRKDANERMKQDYDTIGLIEKGTPTSKIQSAADKMEQAVEKEVEKVFEE